MERARRVVAVRLGLGAEIAVVCAAACRVCRWYEISTVSVYCYVDMKRVCSYVARAG